MDYNLTSLGSREFEHLIQALCLRVLGSGVSVFGDGPDGGREATYRGPVSWGTAEGGEQWNGYTVVQAKFRVRPGDAADNLAWLLRELKVELARWTDKERFKRARTGERPNNLLLVTNVVLSAAQDGGHDTITTQLGELSKEFGLDLAGWKVWYYDQICSLLDAEPRVRTTYGGYITPGDVLGQLSEQTRRGL